MITCLIRKVSDVRLQRPARLRRHQLQPLLMWAWNLHGTMSWSTFAMVKETCREA